MCFCWLKILSYGHRKIRRLGHTLTLSLLLISKVVHVRAILLLSLLRAVYLRLPIYVILRSQLILVVLVDLSLGRILGDWIIHELHNDFFIRLLHFERFLEQARGFHEILLQFLDVLFRFLLRDLMSSLQLLDFFQLL